MAFFRWIYKHEAEPLPDVPDVQDAPVADSDADDETLPLAGSVAAVSESAGQHEVLPRRPGGRPRRVCQEAGLLAADAFEAGAQAEVLPVEVRWLAPTSIRFLHGQYCVSHLHHQGGRPASLGTFVTCYKRHWANVLRIRTVGHHAKCDVCEQLKEAVRKAATEAESAAFQRDYEQHLKQQFADRRTYYQTRAASCEFFSGAGGSDSACLIIDGMDQAKFRVPRTDHLHSYGVAHATCLSLDSGIPNNPRNLPTAKKLQELDRPALHFSGCVVHGLEEHYHISGANLKKDPNTESELIVQGLTAVAEWCRESGSDMPKHVFVQADNCAREMRNQFTLVLGAALLLMLDPVSSITFNFLRVGHTHEDIGLGGHTPQTFRVKGWDCAANMFRLTDQLFSEIAKLLAKQRTLLNPEQFLHAVQGGLRKPRRRGQKLKVSELKLVRDWKKWLASLNLQVSGYTGSGAAHSTRLLRRRGQVLSVDTQSCKYLR